MSTAQGVGTVAETQAPEEASVEEDPTKQWHKTACVLCSANCGIEVRIDGREITRVRGDKDHPASKGYTCEKGLRVNHYQNGRDRLSSPLKKMAVSYTHLTLPTKRIV